MIKDSIDHNKLTEAFKFASELHCKQTRKAEKRFNLPYISHLMSVSAMVMEYGGDEATAIAALLHDAVEDCGGHKTLEQIRKLFGNEVAVIVEDCSDTFGGEKPKGPWKERKLKHIEHIEFGDINPKALMVLSCDKYHNIKSLISQYRFQGEDVWEHFRAGKEETLWYLGEVVHVLSERQPGSPLAYDLNKLFRDLSRLVFLTKPGEI